MTKNVLAEFGDYVEFVELDFKTQTMNETLSFFNSHANEVSVIIGLADSFWSNNELTSVYEFLNEDSNYDGSLALFPLRQSQVGKLGAVEFKSDSLITSIIDKDPNTSFTHAWGALKISTALVKDIDIKLPHIGYSVKYSMSQGYKYDSKVFVVDYFDCGTFAEYKECLVRCSQ